MDTQRTLLLGFDPGGKGTSRGGNFGWSVCQFQGINTIPSVAASGAGIDALDVFNAVKQVLRSSFGGSVVVAAGIDAPMFWGQRGNRIVDQLIREDLGSEAGVSVLEVNSLFSACTVQGVLIGKYLRDEFQDIPITETHPKALLKLLEAANPSEFRVLDQLVGQFSNEHERDATISAYAAWQMLRRPSGWIDLHEIEPSPVQPFDASVQYWMPLR